MGTRKVGQGPPPVVAQHPTDRARSLRANVRPANNVARARAAREQDTFTADPPLWPIHIGVNNFGLNLVPGKRDYFSPERIDGVEREGGWAEFSYVPDRARLFGPMGISPDDVCQGEVGDCGFLAALASLAQRNPKSIKQLIHREPDGTFRVRLWKMVNNTPTPVNIRVDDKVAMLSYSYAPRSPALGHSRDQSLWVSLIEKAYADLNGHSYKNISGTSKYPKVDPMLALTGNPSNTTAITSQSATTAFQAIQSAIARGQLTTASTLHSAPLPDGRLVNDHGYTILAAFKKGPSGTPWLELRNPWGTGSNHRGNGIISISMSDFVKNFGQYSTGSSSLVHEA